MPSILAVIISFEMCSQSLGLALYLIAYASALALVSQYILSVNHKKSSKREDNSSVSEQLYNGK